MFPRFLTVRQHFEDRRIVDIPGAVQQELSKAKFVSHLQRGSIVAVGVGSRGIANIAAIVHAVVTFWKHQGMQPFIFPAMGSHGAATALGQAEVLARYGITEQIMGCPIRSSLDVVSLGETAQGIPVFMDQSAHESDAVMLVNRVKWHTDFAGKIESGLFKMMAIGLGKFAGARIYHSYAYRLGLEQVIRSIGRQVLSSGKIVGGLAILEDAYHNTAQVTAVPAVNMEQCEEELLQLVKSWMGRIPVDLDLLILDEIGKEISGSGMDTKVVNRSVKGGYNPWPDAPRIERIFIRDLSAHTNGNAAGVGFADVISDRVLQKIDWNSTRINSLTASAPAACRTPIHYPTDRQCLEAIVPTVDKIDTLDVTIGWLKNSLTLDLMALSENLLPQIQDIPELEILGEPDHLEFDSLGSLVNIVDWA